MLKQTCFCGRYDNTQTDRVIRFGDRLFIHAVLFCCWGDE